MTCGDGRDWRTAGPMGPARRCAACSAAWPRSVWRSPTCRCWPCRVVALALTPVPFLGLALVPWTMTLVRMRADLERRRASRTGVLVTRPYHPPPERAGAGGWQRFRWTVTDPATWRDLAWLVPGAIVGFALGTIGAVVPLYGLAGLTLTPLWIWLGTGWYGYGAVWSIDTFSPRPALPAAGRRSPRRRPVGGAVAAPRRRLLRPALPRADQGRRTPAARHAADGHARRHGGRPGGGAAPDRTRPARRRPGPPRLAEHDDRPGRRTHRPEPGRRPTNCSPRRASPAAPRWSSCGTWSAASTRRCSPNAASAARSARWR